MISSCAESAEVSTWVFFSALSALTLISESEARSWEMSFLELLRSSRNDWMTRSFSSSCWLRKSTTFCSRSTPCVERFLANESCSDWIFIL